MMKRNFGNGEDAVSMVIDVIRMVAITVVLAAVIGAFVVGRWGDIEMRNVVLATASQLSSDTIVVTYYGGPNHDLVESITVMVNGLQVDDDSDSGNASVITGVDPGYSLTISNTSDVDANNGIANLNNGNLTITSGRNHVIVAARFVDGAEWIILDTYV